MGELIQRLPADGAAFIPRGLFGEGRRIASNIYGHRVLCALLEHLPDQPDVTTLVDEFLADDAAALCCHKFGHMVAIRILASGSTEWNGRIMAALCLHVQRFARHRFASQVLEYVLLNGDSEPHEAREVLVAELLQNAAGLSSLACHCFGTHVVRALTKMPGTGVFVL